MAEECGCDSGSKAVPDVASQTHKSKICHPPRLAGWLTVVKLKFSGRIGIWDILRSETFVLAVTKSIVEELSVDLKRRKPMKMFCHGILFCFLFGVSVKYCFGQTNKKEPHDTVDNTISLHDKRLRVEIHGVQFFIPYYFYKGYLSYFEVDSFYVNVSRFDSSLVCFVSLFDKRRNLLEQGFFTPSGANKFRTLKSRYAGKPGYQIRKCMFRDMVKHGRWLYYNLDGTVREEVIYEMGENEN